MNSKPYRLTAILTVLIFFFCCLFSFTHQALGLTPNKKNSFDNQFLVADNTTKSVFSESLTKSIESSTVLVLPVGNDENDFSSEQLNKFSPTELRRYLENTYKKIIVEDEGYEPNGSGIIISRTELATNEFQYDVLTSAHNFQKGINFSFLQTKDGELHLVRGRTLIQEVANGKKIGERNDGITKFGDIFSSSTTGIDQKESSGYDLAIVNFISENEYPVVPISTQSIDALKDLIVVGYPKLEIENQLDAYKIDFLTAHANSQTESSLDDSQKKSFDFLKKYGYETIYKAEPFVKKGMSGGGVIDPSGKLVAIHGASELEENAKKRGEDTKIGFGISTLQLIKNPKFENYASRFYGVKDINEYLETQSKIAQTAPSSNKNVDPSLEMQNSDSENELLTYQNTPYDEVRLFNDKNQCVDSMTAKISDFLGEKGIFLLATDQLKRSEAIFLYDCWMNYMDEIATTGSPLAIYQQQIAATSERIKYIEDEIRNKENPRKRNLPILLNQRDNSEDLFSVKNDNSGIEKKS